MFASGFLAPDYVWGSERSYDQASTKFSFVLIHRGQAPEQRGSRTSIFSFLFVYRGKTVVEDEVLCVRCVCRRAVRGLTCTVRSTLSSSFKRAVRIWRLLSSECLCHVPSYTRYNSDVIPKNGHAVS